MIDDDLGLLRWDDELEGWEGSIQLASEVPFQLFVFARASAVPDRTITTEARLAVARVRALEPACRQYAADQLLDVHNREWSNGDTLTSHDFATRLTPDGLAIHETGYTEVHFDDGGLFSGHGVGVRIREDGTFQEAVLEG